MLVTYPAQPHTPFLEKTDYLYTSRSQVNKRIEGDSASQHAYAEHLLDEGNISKALDYFKLAAEKKYAPALCRLGELYLLGLGVTKNEPKAREYFRKAAKQNEARALMHLGVMDYQGLGVPSNQEEGQVFLLSAEAHYQTNKNGTYDSLLTWFGIDNTTHYTEPAHIKKEALTCLAAIYQQKSQFAVAHAYREAIAKENTVLSNRASSGSITLYHDDSLSHHHWHLLKRRAQLGDEKIAYAVAKTYEEGKIIQKSLEKAMQYYKIAADKDNHVASLAVAQFYRSQCEWVLAEKYAQQALHHDAVKIEAAKLLIGFFQNPADDWEFYFKHLFTSFEDEIAKYAAIAYPPDNTLVVQLPSSVQEPPEELDWSLPNLLRVIKGLLFGPANASANLSKESSDSNVSDQEKL